MTTLLDQAHEFIASEVSDLRGENDIRPFMLINSPSGHVYVGLTMPEIGSPRNDIADVMSAMLVMYRATEAVFASCAWSVKCMSFDDRKKWGNRDFGEHPDRQEIIFTIYVGSEKDRFHSAPVTRKNNKVGLGDWSEDDKGSMGGRFIGAMHTGMEMARNMPEEVAEFMERAIKTGDEQRVMELIAQTTRRLRTGNITTHKVGKESS